MKSFLSKQIRTLIHKAGFELKRAQDPYQIDLYKRLYSKETLAKKPFYNIGSGTFQHPFWTSIDYDSDWYGKGRDIVHYDLLELSPLPIEEGSAKIHYTSHTIEHVPDDAAQNLFNEAYRTLEKGGIFRVTTGPDAVTDFRALKQKDQDWFYWSKNYSEKGTYEHLYKKPATSVPLEEQWLHHVATQLAPNSVDDTIDKKVTAEEIRQMMTTMSLEEMLDDLTSRVKFNPERPGNHVSWWSHDKIERFMKKAGFKTIYRSGYWQSVSPIMRHSPLFDTTHPQMSIYMEAVR